MLTRSGSLKPCDKSNTERVPLVVTYYPQLPKLQEILRRHLPTLHVSKTMREAVPLPPLVAYCRPKNLRDLLTRATLKPSLEVYEGNSQCCHPRCKMCKIIKTCKMFSSTVTGTVFHVRATATCKTRNIIYLIECNACGIQYVWETENALHIQMNGHRSDINHNHPDTLVVAHFKAPGHSVDDLSVRVIEQVWRDDTAYHKKWERWWIHTFRSVTPSRPKPRRLDVSPQTSCQEAYVDILSNSSWRFFPP